MKVQLAFIVDCT
jgi:hypothetical protein